MESQQCQIPPWSTDCWKLRRTAVHHSQSCLIHRVCFYIKARLSLLLSVFKKSIRGLCRLLNWHPLWWQLWVSSPDSWCHAQQPYCTNQHQKVQLPNLIPSVWHQTFWPNAYDVSCNERRGPDNTLNIKQNPRNPVQNPNQILNNPQASQPNQTKANQVLYSL